MFDSPHPIFAAVKNFNLEYLKQNKEYLLQRDIYGCTVLHYAAYYGQYQILQWLITNQIFPDVDVTDNQGMTALHHAATFGDFNMVKFLIIRKASLSKKEVTKESLWDCATTSGVIDIIQGLFNVQSLTYKIYAMGLSFIYSPTVAGHMDIVNWIMTLQPKEAILEIELTKPDEVVQQDNELTLECLPEASVEPKEVLEYKEEPEASVEPKEVLEYKEEPEASVEPKEVLAYKEKIRRVVPFALKRSHKEFLNLEESPRHSKKKYNPVFFSEEQCRRKQSASEVPKVFYPLGLGRSDSE